MARTMSRRRLLGYGAAGAASAALLGLPARAGLAQVQSHVALIDPKPAQTIEGFGASGAWWPNDLVHFDPAVQRLVADLLFSPGGIGLSAYRYNIGGGGVGVSNPVRAPESFFIAPGEYDWGRDAGGRLFLRMAAERGVPVLLGFVNSAPTVWTTTGKSCSGDLLPDAEQVYAEYLADVVTHLHDDDGITLGYLSPMNEPRYTFDGCGQEGMAVPAVQRAAVIQAPTNRAGWASTSLRTCRAG
jgi:O-glycosyl hydrolase